jgi:hypothetical protein
MMVVRKRNGFRKARPGEREMDRYRGGCGAEASARKGLEGCVAATPQAGPER